MFEGRTTGRSDAELLDTMREAQRAERRAMARYVLAAGRLCRQRAARADAARELWCVDDYDVVAAEISAELGISRGRAASLMHHGLTLLERLPRLGARFAAGDIDFRIITTVDYRTGLITDPELLTRLDGMLARYAPNWNKLSRRKLTDYIDRLVVDVDPEAVRLARQSDVDRHVEVEMTSDGMADVSGSVRGPDAVAFDRRLDEIAATVCRNDPRTKQQRRADAIGALGDGKDALACTCGADDCPAADADTADAAPGGIVIHVLAEAESVHGDGATPGYLVGHGAVPAATLRELTDRAKLRPVVHPGDAPPEPRYRPSAALADFVRCRDLTCRFPGCDQPAQMCELDHTVPYPAGPTHASNLKLLCTVHHLMKTFHCGADGWRDLQLPDGTVLWTSPSGRIHPTKPHGAMLYPQLAAPTGELDLPAAPTPTKPGRGMAMPTRRRSRADDRAYRVEWERAINRARYEDNPPPF